MCTWFMPTCIYSLVESRIREIRIIFSEKTVMCMSSSSKKKKKNQMYEYFEEGKTANCKEWNEQFSEPKNLNYWKIFPAKN